MAIEIVVPRLGWSMERGIFVRWLKGDGESVRRGDPLFEIEGEKAVQEIEAIDAGHLRLRPGGPRPGDAVSVGQVIGLLVAPEEAAAPAEPAPPSPTASPAGPGAAVPTSEARSDPPPSGCAGAREPVPHSAGGAKSSPRARRLATELGVDWRGVPGTGRNGRVRERDVRNAAEHRRTEDR